MLETISQSLGCTFENLFRIQIAPDSLFKQK